jgi:hypothetical protein
LGLYFFGFGAFLVIGCALNWNWLFKNSGWKAINLVDILTRTGVRILGIILGLAMSVIGILVMIGVMKP